MKCHNCGFETDSKFCPMCGTPASINDTDNNKPSVDTVPKQSKPDIQENISNTNMNNNAQDFTSFESATTPQPIAQNPQSAYFQKTQTEKNSKAKVLTIVISSVLAVVILSGVIINIVSSGFDKSLTKTLSNMSEDSFEDVDSIKFYSEMYGQPYKIGEKVNMDSSSVKIKSATVKDASESFSPVDKKDYLCLSLVVEITNNTNETQPFDGIFNVRPVDDMNIYFSELPKEEDGFLYDETTDSFLPGFYYEVEAKQTKCIEYQFSVSKYAESVAVLYNFIDKNDALERCMFEIDVPAKN